MSDLPDGWEVATLSDFAEVRLGRQRSPKNHTGDNMKPYLRAANVGWDGLKLDDVKEMNFTAEETETYELRPGDIVLSEASGSPDEVGKPAIWRGERQGVCFQNTLIRVRSEDVLPEYLLRYFEYQARTGAFARASRGVGIHHLGATTLAASQVPVPPLEEQKRIVERLDEALSVIDAAEKSLLQIRRRVDVLRVAVLQWAVTGLWDLTGTFWDSRKLKTLLREPLRNGHSAPRSKSGQGVRIFTLTAVTLGAFTTENTKLCVGEPSDFKDLVAQVGDIFVQRSNTSELVGTARLYSGPEDLAIFPDLLIRVRVNDEVRPEWVELALRSEPLRRYFKSNARGIAGSMPKISQATIEDAEIPVPSLNVQDAMLAEVARFESVLGPSELSIWRAAELCRKLRRATLMAAFSGELVAQDQSDEPASALLDRIKASQPPTKPTRSPRTSKVSK